MQIPNVSHNRPQKIISRQCQFPGCDEVFTIVGGGKDKYCPEHKKKKYRSELYSVPKDVSAVNDINGNPLHPKDVNVIKKFDCTKAFKTELICECCKKPYDVLALPSESMYPKYCPEHRNEYKRNRYLLSNPPEAQEPITIIDDDVLFGQDVT